MPMLVGQRLGLPMLHFVRLAGMEAVLASSPETGFSDLGKGDRSGVRMPCANSATTRDCR